MAEVLVHGVRVGLPDVSQAAMSVGEHLHSWRRVPDSVGLFACRSSEACRWFAVCPGCLGSLDTALRVRDGLTGMALYWCPVHQGSGEHDGEP